MKVNIDGTLYDRAAAAVSVFDHGLLYGDGVFEGIRIYTARECFLTCTGAEIIPVVTIDGRIIGDGKPGPMTFRLQEAFHDYIQQQDDHIDLRSAGQAVVVPCGSPVEDAMTDRVSALRGSIA